MWSVSYTGITSVPDESLTTSSQIKHPWLFHVRIRKIRFSPLDSDKILRSISVSSIKRTDLWGPFYSWGSLLVGFSTRVLCPYRRIWEMMMVGQGLANLLHVLIFQRLPTRWVLGQSTHSSIHLLLSSTLTRVFRFGVFEDSWCKPNRRWNYRGVNG